MSIRCSLIRLTNLGSPYGAGIYLRCDSGVSRIRYHEAGYFGISTPEIANDGGAMAPDFTSDHTFLAEIDRKQPSVYGGTDGTCVLTVTDGDVPSAIR